MGDWVLWNHEFFTSIFFAAFINFIVTVDYSFFADDDVLKADCLPPLEADNKMFVMTCRSAIVSVGEVLFDAFLCFWRSGVRPDVDQTIQLRCV